jgi:hypothetical protein
MANEGADGMEPSRPRYAASTKSKTKGFSTNMKSLMHASADHAWRWRPSRNHHQPPLILNNNNTINKIPADGVLRSSPTAASFSSQEASWLSPVQRLSALILSVSPQWHIYVTNISLFCAQSHFFLVQFFYIFSRFSVGRKVISYQIEMISQMPRASMNCE